VEKKSLIAYHLEYIVYQLAGYIMDDKVILRLVDAALKGDKNLAQMAVRLLASKIRSTNSGLYKQLSEKLEIDVLRGRHNKNLPLPVDADSRQSLIRVEDPVLLTQAPTHSSDIKEALDQILLERKHLDDLLGEGLYPTRSVIFQGPPGVGKTMSARWLANKLQLPLLTLDLATVMSSFLGKTGSNVRAVLEHAMSFPCVLLLDEFDAIAKRRDDDRELGELKRLVTVLLQAIDDWPHTSLLIAATNHAELLDPAIWRRFDLEIVFPMPTLDMIKKYLDEYWPDVVNSDDSVSKFLNMSFSNINRELKQAKRERVITYLHLKSITKKENIAEFSCMDMNEKKRWAVKLYEEGLSQRAISQKLGISRPTVKKVIEEFLKP
jgi:SpoVK/Ycf46/Vps4 family AAA+-type ATPase